MLRGEINSLSYQFRFSRSVFMYSKLLKRHLCLCWFVFLFFETHAAVLRMFYSVISVTEKGAVLLLLQLLSAFPVQLQPWYTHYFARETEMGGNFPITKRKTGTNINFDTALCSSCLCSRQLAALSTLVSSLLSVLTTAHTHTAHFHRHRMSPAQRYGL